MEGKYNRGLTFHFLIYNSSQHCRNCLGPIFVSLNDVRGSTKDVLQ